MLQSNQDYSIQIKVFKTNESVQIPQFATKGSACFDIRANLVKGEYVKSWWTNLSSSKPVDEHGSITLRPNERLLVPTGLCFDLPVGKSLRLHPRSGLALKQGLTLINAEGVVDTDYVEPVFAAIVNLSGEPQTIADGDRICQGEIVNDHFTGSDILFIETQTHIERKSERAGGFGSTGTK